MRYVNWSFLEAGHGKGAADRIGGVLKRTADRLVAQGMDLPDGQAVFKALKANTKVKLFYVPEPNVGNVVDYLSPVKLALKPIPGTMLLHQLVCSEPGRLMCRQLSCFCSEGNYSSCQCYPPTFHTFPTKATPDKCENHVSDEGDNGPSSSSHELRPVHVYSDDLIYRKVGRCQV